MYSHTVYVYALYSLIQVTTSSILGAPPTVKYHSFGPPTAVAGGNSILGAPQMLPMYGNANTQPRMVSPVPSIFPNKPPPPTVIQAPQGTQQQQQPAGGQTSILGQPPPIFGGTMLPQGFSPAFPNLYSTLLLRLALIWYHFRSMVNNNHLRISSEFSQHRF